MLSSVINHTAAGRADELGTGPAPDPGKGTTRVAREAEALHLEQYSDSAELEQQELAEHTDGSQPFASAQEDSCGTLSKEEMSIRFAKQHHPRKKKKKMQAKSGSGKSQVWS